MSETYEMTPVEKYDFIRRNKKSISFDGYYNHVHIDAAARTITIDVDDDYEFIEEGNEYKRLKNFDSPEQRLIDAIFRPHLIDDDGKRIGTPENEDDYRFFPIVSHKDITKKFNGDYVYAELQNALNDSLLKETKEQTKTTIGSEIGTTVGANNKDYYIMVTGNVNLSSKEMAEILEKNMIYWFNCLIIIIDLTKILFTNFRSMDWKFELIIKKRERLILLSRYLKQIQMSGQ